MKPIAAILFLTLLTTPGGRGDLQASEDTMTTDQNLAAVFEFDADVLELDWYSVDDRVMGGVSRSTSSRFTENALVFEGNLSLERNGGFASIRSEEARFDLSGYEALVLRVRGDGNRYQLSMRTDGRFDGIRYRATFDTRDGEWLIVRLPLEAFRPTWRGRWVPNAGPLDASRIRSFGIMISDKQEGAFQLEIDWIAAGF